jgi:biotin carboxylase
MHTKNVVLSINVVEPALVRAVKALSKELGIELEGLMLVDTEYASEPNRPKDTSGLFEEIVCDFDSPDELQTALKPFLDRILLATVRYESAIQSFRKVIPFIPYVHTPTETSLLWATDKSLMRDRLANYDQRLVPRYQYIEQSHMPHLNDIIHGFKYPLIAKPNGLAGSLLVARCNNELELRACLDKIFAASKEVYDRVHHQNMPGVMIEEMMQGPMYSTDAYVMPDGEVLCLPLVEVVTGHAVGLPGFYGHSQGTPTGLPEAETKEAARVSTDAIKALGLRTTVAHVELFRTPDGWKIIEVGARIGGYRQDLYREAYGIDHFYNDLCIRMGKLPKMPVTPVKHAVAINIYAEEEGVITSIEGFREARKLPSILFLKEYAQPGDIALFSDKGGQPIVDGILSNTDIKQLEQDVAEVRRLVKVTVQDHAAALVTQA